LPDGVATTASVTFCRTLPYDEVVTAYRSMVQASAPPLPRKWPHRVILAGFVFVTLVSLVAGFIDFACFMDGPGVGYFGSNGSGTFVFCGTAFVAAVLSIAFFVRWPWARWSGTLIGFVSGVAFVASGAPVKGLHLAWGGACVRGDNLACLAAARAAPTKAKATVFARRACDRRDEEACKMLGEAPTQ
jgi:hypothetical protein